MLATPKTTSADQKRGDAVKGKDQDDEENHREPCNVVFTHTNADFDSLAAAVALSLIWKHENPDIPTHVVFPRGTHPIVQRFLAFHKHLLPVRGFKTILPEDVHAIGVVDAQALNRIGRGKAWLDHAQSIHIYDHHDGQPANGEFDENASASLLDRATEVVIDKVGSTTTLLVEKLKAANIKLKPHEATLFSLGIRADTGGLVYEGTTLRDALALVWCMENGASQTAISEFGVAKIVGDTQRWVLQKALKEAQTNLMNGLRVSSVLIQLEDSQYVAGLAQVCEEIMELTDSDVFLLGATHKSSKKGTGEWISLIGRASARAVGVDLNAVLSQFQGGGHPKAAAAALRCIETDEVMVSSSINDMIRMANEGTLPPSTALQVAVSMIQAQIPQQLLASSFMSENVITIDVDSTIAEAKELFDEHNLKSCPVVEDYQTKKFKSLLKLSDIVKAIRAGRSNDKIKGMIRPVVKTVLPDTPMAELEDILMEGAGRIPVVDDDGALVGIVTRTDVLRQHNFYRDCLPEIKYPLPNKLQE